MLDTISEAHQSTRSIRGKLMLCLNIELMTNSCAKLVPKVGLPALRRSGIESLGFDSEVRHVEGKHSWQVLVHDERLDFGSDSHSTLDQKQTQLLAFLGRLSGDPRILDPKALGRHQRSLSVFSVEGIGVARAIVAHKVLSVG